MRYAALKGVAVCTQVELVSEEFASEHDPTSRVPLLADLRCVWQARERVGGGLSFRSMFHDIPMWFSVTADGDFRVQEHYSASSCDLILEESPTDGWTLHTEDGVASILSPPLCLHAAISSPHHVSFLPCLRPLQPSFLRFPFPGAALPCEWVHDAALLCECVLRGVLFLSEEDVNG